jgi:hypothetical protein
MLKFEHKMSSYTICSFTKYCKDDQIGKDDMDSACSTHDRYNVCLHTAALSESVEGRDRLEGSGIEVTILGVVYWVYLAYSRGWW